MKKQEVIELVKRHLDNHQPNDFKLSVVPEATREEDDWWYVGIKPNRQIRRQYDYYNVLAEVELEIEDEFETKNPELNILLVPVSAD